MCFQKKCVDTLPEAINETWNSLDAAYAVVTNFDELSPFIFHRTWHAPILTLTSFDGSSKMHQIKYTESEFQLFCKPIIKSTRFSTLASQFLTISLISPYLILLWQPPVRMQIEKFLKSKVGLCISSGSAFRLFQLCACTRPLYWIIVRKQQSLFVGGVSLFVGLAKHWVFDLNGFFSAQRILLSVFKM